MTDVATLLSVLVVGGLIVFGIFLILGSLDKLNRKWRIVMAAIDDLNTAVGVLTTNVSDLSTEVAALTPAAPVDLSGAIAGVTAAGTAVAQATADLKAKFPPA